MRKAIGLTAVGSLLASGGMAMADHQSVEELILGPQTLIFGEHATNVPSKVFNFDLVLGDNNQPVVGFRIDFDYVNIFNDSSWASDLEMKLTTPGGQQIVFGQFSFNGGDPFCGFSLLYEEREQVSARIADSSEAMCEGSEDIDGAAYTEICECDSPSPRRRRRSPKGYFDQLSPTRRRDRRQDEADECGPQVVGSPADSACVHLASSSPPHIPGD